MPKLKTHSGTKKRIRVTKTGKVLRRHSMRSHFLQKKSAARKRQLAGFDSVVGKNAKNLKRKLGV
ncbi:MAG: 50S ribosomal protein L35 [Candidatus Paceibacterota bacterium]|jgi:large subunit ribosomal protein L35